MTIYWLIYVQILNECNHLYWIDVAPVHTDCNLFVQTQRREVFEDLQNALKVMNIINDQTSIPNALYAMWLLENKQLRLGININVSSY